MKCPECGYDQKVKYGMSCSGCHYQFTFNPKESANGGLTDGKFKACIRLASANDTSYFTRNQLYAAYCRRMTSSPTLPFVIGASTMLAAFLFLVGGYSIPAMISGGIGFLCLVIVIQRLMQKCTRAAFNRHLSKWLNSGKSIDRLLDAPSLHEPPPNWSEPDIYDYGVERILIVQHDLLVDLLVKNGVHAEHRMLVLSESGYPNYLIPAAQRLLDEQPELPVFLLHDASEVGAEMESRVTSNGVLRIGSHPLTDLGMFPSDFKKLKRTKSFDPDNARRELPVDAMQMPFMTMGLGAAMAGGLAFGSMIEEQETKGGSSTGFDFG